MSWRINFQSTLRGVGGAVVPAARKSEDLFHKWRHCGWTAVTMADSEATKETACSFLFKKSTKKFAGRKRKASDSDKGRPLVLYLCF